MAAANTLTDQIREDIGTITLDPNNVYPSNESMTLLTERKPEHIKFTECRRLIVKAAIVIGIHRKSYVHIPEELLIHFNDYFLFKICEVNKKQNLTASGLEARTEMSTTVREFPQITGKENMIYPGIFERYGIKDKTC